MTTTNAKQPLRIRSARVLRTTEKALLLAVSIVEPDPYGTGFAEYEREAWIPLSKIEDRDDRDDGTISLIVPKWLAVDRGLVFEGTGRGRFERVWTA